MGFNFGSKQNWLLVHQLIRQYVMARILLDFSSELKQKEVVVPFHRWDKADEKA